MAAYKVIPYLDLASIDELLGIRKPQQDLLELLKEVGKAKEQKDREEYQKLIENGNGNGDNH